MTNANEISITAVIPAYNCDAWIARSIDSVLNQTHPVDEVIVVDDGSTDGTAEVIKAYGDRVRYLYQANAGVSAARNAGIQAATGNWIAFLDADDEWLPDKIKRQTDLLTRHPDLMWTTGNFIKCLCEEKRRGAHTPRKRCQQYLNSKEYFESYFRAIQWYQWGHTDCMVIRKSVFEQVGNFQPDLSLGEDVDLWLRIAYRYPAVGFSAEPLAVYHLSSEDSLMKKSRSENHYADFIQRHLDLAQQAAVSEAFQPAASFIAKRWIRGLLFEDGKSEIRAIIKRFPGLFSGFYRKIVYLLTVCPHVSTGVFRVVSKIVRTLKLRRHVTSPPRTVTKEEKANGS